jgi:dsDNA-binding SOS-regulon protein
MYLSIEQLTDIPLSALREQLRADAQRADQEQVEADAVWLARQEDEVAA